MSTLYYLNQYITKTLNGAIDDSQTTGIEISNSTGVETAKPGIACITWADPLNTANAEWITYTSISANELQGVTRGAEGFSVKSHLNGAVVSFPLSESHINNLNDTVKEAVIEFVIDGGGSAIETGIKGDLEIPFACTISRATALADQSGSIVVDIWKDTYANYPPIDADSITASAPITITTATKSQDSTLTGWTKSITAGDILRFNVDSCTDIERVTISLKVSKA